MNNYIIEKINSIDSTNDELTREIDDGILNCDKVLIARKQTNGHGAHGKKFISDNYVGIYFTLLHFYNNTNELKYITQKAAVAIYNTFNEIFGIDLSIKWINDLYYEQKKIAGILCRNLIKHNAVIIGIGIDLFYNINIDDRIKDIAGYVFKDIDELLNAINNKLLSENLILFNSINNDFKNKRIYDDDNIWHPDSIVKSIVDNIYKLIEIDELPKIYVEKNICKDLKVYEDCVLEC